MNLSNVASDVLGLFKSQGMGLLGSNKLALQVCLCRPLISDALAVSSTRLLGLRHQLCVIC